MTAADDIKKQHDVVIPSEEPMTPEDEGEASIGGSMPDLESDDDASEGLEKIIGNEPEAENIADEVNKDEIARIKNLDEEEQK